MNVLGVAKMAHTSSAPILQLVSFRLGDEHFGVEILKVREINRMLEITKVPHSPDFVEGVINLRGTLIPIIDLRKRFGLRTKDHDRLTRVVVAQVDGNTFGFVVDAVTGVSKIQASTVEAAPPIVAGVDAEYIQGVSKSDDRLLILLDLERIFSAGEEKQLKKVA